MPDIPHFAYPFQFSNATHHVMEVEQDTIDDVVGCVSVSFITELGFRPEVPTFGTPDMVFANQPVDLSSMIQAIEEWEPRVSLVLEEETDSRDILAAEITAAARLRQMGLEGAEI